MHLSPPLLADVRDQLFADWASAITLRELNTSYDPTTGELQTVPADTTLLAVLGPSRQQPHAGTAGVHQPEERMFLIRSEDLPTEVTFSSTRVLYENRQYHICRVEHASFTPLTILHTVSCVWIRVTISVAVTGGPMVPTTARRRCPGCFT